MHIGGSSREDSYVLSTVDVKIKIDLVNFIIQACDDNLVLLGVLAVNTSRLRVRLVADSSAQVKHCKLRCF